MAKHGQRSTPDDRHSPERIYTLAPLPRRPESGHKGLFGRVLVLGGSPAMIGAPVLAGTAALRCGTGLVQIAMAPAPLLAALSITPELIGLALDDRSDRALAAAAEQADVLVVGPGMGQSPTARRRLRALIDLDKPMVVDADALNLLAAEKTWSSFPRQAVLTPHPGEMRRLSRVLGVDEKLATSDDDRQRIRVAVAAVKRPGDVLVLKAHRSVITDGRRVYVNRTGNSALSKAGSGDVLSGIIGSLIGQGMDNFGAACAGAWIHGRAGEIAGKKSGLRGVLARDVIDAIPAAMSAYR